MHLFKRRIRKSQPRITGINLLSSHSLTHALNHAYIDNLNTTQTLEYTKDRYNVKIRNKGSLLRSHQQPT
jgi:hypothetical protein